MIKCGETLASVQTSDPTIFLSYNGYESETDGGLLTKPCEGGLRGRYV
jgi:hypothetical protein